MTVSSAGTIAMERAGGGAGGVEGFPAVVPTDVAAGGALGSGAVAARAESAATGCGVTGAAGAVTGVVAESAGAGAGLAGGGTDTALSSGVFV
jgi:hypothetical protein